MQLFITGELKRKSGVSLRYVAPTEIDPIYWLAIL
jgi:hypothetical protein